MPVASMRDLLAAGVHFGHRTPRWNPKMAQFIFGARGGVHIIDLQHTVRALDRAAAFMRATAASGGEVVFVGTKRQAQEVVREQAERCGAHFVQHRWLGGTLTNFETLRARLQRLRELEAREAAGEFETLSKKDAQRLRVELARLTKKMGGVKHMSRLPAGLFIIDPKRESNAVTEARKLDIPIVAIVDTNCDPEMVDYVIPGNDDAIRSITAVTTVVADAVLAGQEEFRNRQAEREARLAREAQAALAAAARAEAQGESAGDIEAAMLAAASEAGNVQQASAEHPGSSRPAAASTSVDPQGAPRGRRRPPPQARGGRRRPNGRAGRSGQGAPRPPGRARPGQRGAPNTRQPNQGE
ncbi:MAG: 30S ribosomal protein S2 [Chloroflexi bacterium]|nr:30S ribosomal protein S2 [Chloroflexota bacterium]